MNYRTKYGVMEYYGRYKQTSLPNPGISRLRKKQNVAAGMGKIGMAALVVDFRQINFGSIAATTILSTRLLKTEAKTDTSFSKVLI